MSQENNMTVETATEQQQDEKLDSVLLCNRVVKGTKEDIDEKAASDNVDLTVEEPPIEEPTPEATPPEETV